MQVSDLANALRERVKNVADLKEALTVAPDVAGVNPEHILFTHRQCPDAEIYFLTNQDDVPMRIESVFRVTGMVPELWHPETGRIEGTARMSADGATRVPLRLDACGSVFVVFRNPSSREVPAKPAGGLTIKRASYEAVDWAGALDVTARLAGLIADGRLDLAVTNGAMGKAPALLHPKQLKVEYVIDGKPGSVTVPENRTLSLASGAEVSGPWNVEFPNRKAEFDRLVSWTDRPEPDIKYHSGEATYRTTIQLPPMAAKSAITVDLGQVESLAEVTVNGHALPGL